MSGRLVRLSLAWKERGRFAWVKPDAVELVRHGESGENFATQVGLRRGTLSVDGSPLEVMKELFSGQEDADVMREMREVLAHIRREDRDTTEMTGAVRGFRLLCDRLGLEWKP